MRFFKALSVSTVVLGVATSATSATYDLIVVAKNQGEATNSSAELSINESGTIAYEDFYRDPPNGSATDNRFQIETVDENGNFTESFDVGVPVGASIYQSPIHNDAGQTLAITTLNPGTGFATQQLVILEADGVTKTVLAERLIFDTPADPNIPTYSNISTFDIAINDVGDAVARVNTLGGATQLVRFPAGGGAPEVVYDSTTSEIFGITGVDINDSGQVVFVGTEQGGADPRLTSTQSVYVADGTTTSAVVSASFELNLLGSPSINNVGDVAVAVFERTGFDPEAGYLIQEAGEPSATATFVGEFNTSGGLVTALNLNDYGQVAYKYDNDVYVDGELILETLARIDGVAGTVRDSNLAIDLRQNFGFNDAGQVVLGVDLTADSPTTGIDASAILRADPEGATPDKAILPSAEVDGVFKVGFDLVNALGFEDGSPIYVDPIFGTGLSYSITNGGPNFTSLTVPTQDLGGLSMFDVVFGSFSQSLMFGEVLDFNDFVAGGVSTFEIFGTGGATSDKDFVAGFTFADLGRVEMDITNVTRDDSNPNVIPLPAGVWLLLGGIGMLGALRRL